MKFSNMQKVSYFTLTHSGLAPSSHFARVGRMEFLVFHCSDFLDFSNVIFDLRDISGCQDCTCNLPQSLPWSVSNSWMFYICMWELALDSTFFVTQTRQKSMYAHVLILSARNLSRRFRAPGIVVETVSDRFFLQRILI